jgi:prevent-host-death family protein
MKQKSTTKLIDALSARTHFGEVMERAAKQNLRFLVSQRGKPKVVILGVEDYLRNIIKQPKILTKIQLNAQKTGLDLMTDEEINVEVENFRDSKK